MFNLRPTSIFDFPSDFDIACSALSLGCLPLSLVTSQRSAQLSPPLEVRRSGVHGRGVYATQFIPEGTRIINTPANAYPGRTLLTTRAIRTHSISASKAAK